MGNKTKILVIDDEIDFCMLMKANLEETGEFEVVFSDKPKEAEDLTEQEKPDVILLDNVMPQRKGSEIVEGIRKRPAIKDIPIIMVSGRGEMVYDKNKDQFRWRPDNPVVRDRGDIVEGKNYKNLSEIYGVDDYISKPFTTDILVQVIDEVLGKKRGG